MEFIRQEGQNLIVQNLFNEEHALQLLSTISSNFNCITFKNVGIKIMKLILNAFEEVHVTSINIDYNWNNIMMSPKLVCYDKNQWKTLQQLNNWNREWCQLFSNCYFLSCLNLNLECSWMDAQFAQLFLGAISRIPNIQAVQVNFGSKCKEVEGILSAIQKAKIFSQFNHHFRQLN